VPTGNRFITVLSLGGDRFVKLLSDNPLHQDRLHFQAFSFHLLYGKRNMLGEIVLIMKRFSDGVPLNF